jgi:hypothetical protein
VLLIKWVSAPKTPDQSIGKADAELMLRVETMIQNNRLNLVTVTKAPWWYKIYSQNSIKSLGMWKDLTGKKVEFINCMTCKKALVIL